jgi:hypothetical protein
MVHVSVQVVSSYVTPWLSNTCLISVISFVITLYITFGGNGNESHYTQHSKANETARAQKRLLDSALVWTQQKNAIYLVSNIIISLQEFIQIRYPLPSSECTPSVYQSICKILQFYLNLGPSKSKIFGYFHKVLFVPNC